MHVYRKDVHVLSEPSIKTRSPRSTPGLLRYGPAIAAGMDMRAFLAFGVCGEAIIADGMRMQHKKRRRLEHLNTKYRKHDGQRGQNWFTLVHG
jgi:hypothetical protein